MTTAQLVELGGTTGEPEIVLLPPGGGGVLRYLGLAEVLRGYGHVTAIRAPGLLPGEQPDTSVPAMVNRYLPLLQALPNPPRLLAGWSLGGVLAWELATRLSIKDGPLAVMMVDSFPAWRETTPESRAANVRRIVGTLGGGLAIEERDRLRRTAIAHVEAASQHRVTTDFPGDVLLVACMQERETDPEADWGHLAPRLRVHRVDCSHYEGLTESGLLLMSGRIQRFLRELGYLTTAPAETRP
jgi:thioesterase domain-containing protein